MSKVLEIAVDTREQAPHHELEGCEISKGVTVHYVSRPLYVFDYACANNLTPTNGKLMIPGLALERKSLADLIGSLFNGANFKRELAKIAKAKEIWGNDGRPIIYVIDDGDYEAISKYNYSRFPSGRVTAKAVVSKINKMRYEHNVHMIQCRSKIQAEYTIASILKQHWVKVCFLEAVRKKSII